MAETESTKTKSVKWHLIIFALIGLYGLYGSTTALIDRNWGLWFFWLIVGGLPFTIVGVTVIKHYHAKFR